MKTKPVCNRSSKSHFASARLKYFRRVTICLVTTIAFGLMTQIVIPEFRIYWVLGWALILPYFIWRHWIELASGGYFECDECRKLKSARHIKEFIVPHSGVRHVWCDVCLPAMRERADAMKEIRSIIAGMIKNDRLNTASYSRSTPDPWTQRIHVAQALRKPVEPEIRVSDPNFPMRHLAPR
ncbi:MAG: hypothetical protein COV01_03450 [Candidatus Taylorbacteria bacterium CG10_big_fil_rev_8_21_14_0_10_41_48]|uniref:Uncharacterized protein n=1 Tax=Candidatus Taylorbacteria bacterium CG10_big_fil_rev_8_21_14_0_10_41_48 TaxID=1975024 RepID=A0A2M8LB75_9BACT|nr:MAG: hypothetical protein COV01_03450 [Candidatus Taylorbacteria bacterium CG10_big_fil_rev_8_21_14_0_10_41_48]